MGGKAGVEISAGQNGGFCRLDKSAERGETQEMIGSRNAGRLRF